MLGGLFELFKMGLGMLANLTPVARGGDDAGVLGFLLKFSSQS